MSTFKELSNQNFNGTASIEHINAGSLQRIADAAEKMAGNYIKLQNDLEWSKKRCNELEGRISIRDKHISALRGQITKLKNKLNKQP